MAVHLEVSDLLKFQNNPVWPMATLELVEPIQQKLFNKR